MSKSTECFKLILTAKENYQKKIAEKLDNPFTVPKAYWSILNNFLGKKKLLIFHLDSKRLSGFRLYNES